MDEFNCLTTFHPGVILLATISFKLKKNLEETAMPFDGLFLYGVHYELNNKLQKGRIEKIYQPAREEIIMVISQPGKKYRLLLNANAENTRAHITWEVKQNPITPPMFCMLLRKHLEGGRIREFHQSGLERVLDIQVDCYDELGRPTVKSLICEIMGRHSNIILVSKTDNKILDGIRRYSHAVSRHREVLPSQPYIPPPIPNKADPLIINEESFRDTILGGHLDDTLTLIMQKSLNGLSIPICREIVKLAGLKPDIILDHCGEHELRKIWQSLQRVITAAQEKKLQPFLVCDTQGNHVDFFPIEITPNESWKYIPGEFNETADAFYSKKLAREILRQQKSSIMGKIKKEIKRIQKKLALQRKSIKDARKADQLRLYGELLTANLYRIERDISEVELENYHDPEAKKITIPLAPELTGSENAQVYFKKYNKARNTQKRATQMAQLSEEELQYFESVASTVELAENINDLEEIIQELASQGYIKQPNTNTPSKKQQVKNKKPRPKPLQYISSDGFIVLAGKNNRLNDILTFKISDEEDIWLHTCKIPGSHIIIRTGGQKVPESTLLEAAALAAYFSKARESNNVPVDYTLRKYVKKPNGAKPGYVIYEKQKTVFVNPRSDYMQSLNQE